jgi:hypothetical protein
MGTDRKRAIKLIAKNLGWPPDRANTTLKKADALNTPLSRLLTDQGVSADDALALACLVAQLPPTPLDWVDLVRDLDGKAFDPVLLWQMQVVPFAEEGKLLKVAFWSPDDARNDALFRKRTVRAYLALENEITAALLALVGPPPHSDTLSLSKDQMIAVEEFTTTGNFTTHSSSGFATERSSVWATNPGAALQRMALAADVPVMERRMANEKTVLKGNQVGDPDAVGEVGTAAEESLFGSAGAEFESDFAEDSLSEKDTELMTASLLEHEGLPALEEDVADQASGFEDISAGATHLIPGRKKKKS